MYDFNYRKATSADDAVKTVTSASEGKFMSGGMTLIPTLKQRLAKPSDVVDLATVPGLAGISVSGKMLVIGAMTRHAVVNGSADVKKAIPALAKLAGLIGDPQVRNRGTVGGSLAHADPAADYPAVMLALDAEIHLKGPGGWRVVKAPDFFQDLFTVNMAADEIMASVQFAPVRSAAYAKLHQRASHYAIVGVAAALEVSGGQIRSARVGVTGAASHAIRLRGVEKALAGRPASAATIDNASKAAAAELGDVNADLHASAEYRRAMVGVFTRRALTAALARS